MPFFFLIHSKEAEVWDTDTGGTAQNYFRYLPGKPEILTPKSCTLLLPQHANAQSCYRSGRARRNSTHMVGKPKTRAHLLVWSVIERRLPIIGGPEALADSCFGSVGQKPCRERISAQAAERLNEC